MLIKSKRFVRERRSALEQVMRVAAPKLDQLFGLIGNSGCGVLLCDAQGVELRYHTFQHFYRLSFLEFALVSPLPPAPGRRLGGLGAR